MRILILSDIHGQFYNFKNMPDADLVLIAGDITNIGVKSIIETICAQDFMSALNKKYRKVFWIPGNHDIGIRSGTFEGICIDYKLVEYNSLSIAGISMTTCYDLPELVKHWTNCTCNLNDEILAFQHLPKADIVVSHGPPWGILDLVGDRHIGSFELLKYIDNFSPKLVVCGHVHECPGKFQYKDTLIINTAQKYELLEW